MKDQVIYSDMIQDIRSELQWNLLFVDFSYNLLIDLLSSMKYTLAESVKHTLATKFKC